MCATDLARNLKVPNVVDFIACSSYGDGTESSGNLLFKKDLSVDPCGKNILIVEDLIDTGNTLARIKDHLLSQGPKCLKICCILDKKERRKVEVHVDYIGFTCPD